VAAPGVTELVPISHPFKLASRSCRPEVFDPGVGQGCDDRRDGSGGGGPVPAR